MKDKLKELIQKDTKYENINLSITNKLKVNNLLTKAVWIINLMKKYETTTKVEINL